MPDQYESIKSSLRKSHPKWDESKIKSVASATYIKGGGKVGSVGRHKRAKELAKDKKKN